MTNLDYLSRFEQYVLSIPELSSSEWKYRAEGNVNICFAYNGDNQRLVGKFSSLNELNTI
jgi:hypothetical protein